MSSVFKIELTNKVICITGGYGYLGKAIAESLCAHNGKVYVLGRDINKFNIQFSKQLDNIICFEYCDISESESIAAAFKSIKEKEGRIDVLINNAFYLKGQSPEAMTDEEWNYSIEGTLGSVFKCIREILPYLKKQGSGKIINVSSMYGIVAPDFKIYDESPQFLNPPHYEAAKAGVIQLTKYYASYLGNYGINVNAVIPGTFPSVEVQKDIKFIKQLSDKTCLGRIGNPEDLAGVFVFLSCNAANYITGQNFIVDGGWTTK